jgi:hypothetical protein
MTDHHLLLFNNILAINIIDCRKILIKMRDINGSEIILSADPCTTVLEFKKKYYDINGNPVELQRILFNGLSCSRWSMRFC